MLNIIPRAAWGAAPSRGPLTPVTWKVGGTLWLHHTVSAYIEPEGPPPVTAAELVWTGKRAPNLTTLRIRHPGKLLDVPVRGMDGKWRVYARPSAGRAKRAEWLARVTRTKAAERRAMREIQRFHQLTRGWSDGGYAFVVPPSGRVYLMRGEYVGAHLPGHNSEPSVALMGDYSKRKPTAKQIAAVKAVKVHIFAGNIKGHRQAPYPTSCPGDAAIAAFGL